MKVHFDPETDAMYVIFADAPVAETEEVRPGIMFDLDAQGRVVAIEVLNASRNLASTDLKSLALQVA
ncbi:MAG TPA: DUF2283 domain-containing protein [Rhizomicrobium sp.]